MANVITGTNEDDFLTGNNEADIINGLGGDDEIWTWAGDDFAFGGQGNDTLIVRGEGTKVLYGNSGNDSFDVASFLPAGDRISLVGGDGDDTAVAIVTRAGLVAGTLEFDGEDGNDFLTATITQGQLIYNGGQGNDELKVVSEGGFVTIEGSAGNDTYDLQPSASVVFSFPADDPGIDIVVWRGESFSGFSGIENLTLAVSVDGVVVSLNALNNVITGSAFNDTLNGLAGNDTLNGGAGGDTLNGGLDFDTVTYATSTAGVTINLAGNIGVGGTAAGDRIFECERLIGSNFNDTLGGGIVNSTIDGLAGNDTIDGGVGNNIIRGGAGADNLIGREGNDTFQISGAEGLGDTMSGGTGTDTLRVLGSTDVTLGGFNAAAVSIEQWVGNNKGVLGTAAADIFNFAALTSKTGLLFIDGAGGNDTITASNLADDLRGGAGNDTLNGGSGNDTISGGLGNDVLAGGAGNDHFVFNTAPNSSTNRDSNSDFNAINDTIRLENAIFNALGTATGTLSSAKFWASASGVAHDADDRIIYNTSTGVLSYDTNGNAAGGAVAFAILTGKPALTAADFVVI